MVSASVEGTLHGMWSCWSNTRSMRGEVIVTELRYWTEEDSVGIGISSPPRRQGRLNRDLMSLLGGGLEVNDRSKVVQIVVSMGERNSAMS